MKLTTKNKIIAAGVVLILAIIIIRRVSRNKPEEKIEEQTEANTNQEGKKIVCNSSTVLRKGSKCTKQVKQAQEIINLYYAGINIPRISVDGVFGSKTETGFYDILYKSSGTTKELLEAAKLRASGK